MREVIDQRITKRSRSDKTPHPQSVERSLGGSSFQVLCRDYQIYSQNNILMSRLNYFEPRYDFYENDEFLPENVENDSNDGSIHDENFSRHDQNQSDTNDHDNINNDANQSNHNQSFRSETVSGENELNSSKMNFSDEDKSIEDPSVNNEAENNSLESDFNERNPESEIDFGSHELGTDRYDDVDDIDHDLHNDDTPGVNIEEGQKLSQKTYSSGYTNRLENSDQSYLSKDIGEDDKLCLIDITVGPFCCFCNGFVTPEICHKLTKSLIYRLEENGAVKNSLSFGDHFSIFFTDKERQLEQFICFECLLVDDITVSEKENYFFHLNERVFRKSWLLNKNENVNDSSFGGLFTIIIKHPNFDTKRVATMFRRLALKNQEEWEKI